jgi:hypothetical protein
MKRIRQLALIALLFSSCSHGGTMDDYNNCGLEGDAKRADVRELNTQKNRYDMPDSNAIDHSATLEAMLAQGDDRNRFTGGHAAEITAYVIDVKVGGDESCNCHERDPQNRDTHIELALKPDVPETERVIVEVTPRIRAIMAKKGIDWSTDNLRKMFKGQYVKVKGWLLFDEEHERQALNTAPNNQKDWRATCWEIHPVTSIVLSEELRSKS